MRQSVLPLLALLAVNICFARARHLASTDAALVDIRHIPCTQPGCVNGVEDKALAFSALHDVVLREVAIFVDIFNGTTPPEEMDVECMYWVGDLDEPPIHAAGKARRMFDDHFKYSPYVVKCPDPIPLLKAAPRWASFEVDGTDMGVRLLVEQVSLQQQGTIGACNGVVNSDHFEQLYEWLHHYTVLGVEGFHIYFTNQTVMWAGGSGVGSRGSRFGQPTEDPPRPFSYPRTTWIHFEHLPLDERWLFSQITIYNDCVYRFRHAYTYLAMLDMDEFLVIRDQRFERTGGLKALLHHMFPPQHAALGIYRYAYREDCREGEPRSDKYIDRFTHRLKDTESHTVLHTKRVADKLFVRPDRVDVFYVHHLASARDSYITQAANVQPSMAYLMHIRSYGHDCSELTDEAPFDGD